MHVKHEYTCHVDVDGVIWHDGEPFDAPELYAIVHRTAEKSEDGRTFATCLGERLWLECEDTPFVVEMVRVATDAAGRAVGVTLVLKGGVEEPLDPETLTVGDRNVLYTMVKDAAFRARFTRKAYYELARHLSQRGDEFFLVLGGREYPISGEIADDAST